MRTRPVNVAGGNRDVVLLLEQVSPHGANRFWRVGEQVSFWSAPREKFAKRNVLHVCRMEIGEQKNSLNAARSSKKSGRKVEKRSGTIDRQASNPGNGASQRTATHTLSSTASNNTEDSSGQDEYDTEEDEGEYDMELSHYRGLVLDLAYRPINIVCWRRALCLDILEKADVLEYYDHVINSPSRTFPIPAVLRITDYVHSPKRNRVILALSRKNIFLRDRNRCQYCNSRDNLTVDHVIPLSRGGEWTWENLVTACSRCNVKKGNKTLEAANMQLIKQPREPKELDGREIPPCFSAYKTLSGSRRMPTEWLDYLSKRPPRP